MLARQLLCRELDLPRPDGGDYRELASHFNMSTQDIQTITQTFSPTDYVLDWAGRNPINTIAKLQDVLVTMGRVDCGLMIQSGMYCYFI